MIYLIVLILRNVDNYEDAQCFELKCKENCTRCHADTDNSKPSNSKSQWLSSSAAHFNVSAGLRQNMEKNRNKGLESKVNQEHPEQGSIATSNAF